MRALRFHGFSFHRAHSQTPCKEVSRDFSFESHTVPYSPCAFMPPATEEPTAISQKIISHHPCKPTALKPECPKPDSPPSLPIIVEPQGLSQFTEHRVCNFFEGVIFSLVVQGVVFVWFLAYWVKKSSVLFMARDS